MRFIYLLARTYPYWALAMAAVLFQLAIFFRRRQSNVQYTLGGIIGFLILGTVVWFAFRGDLYSDHWVRAIAGE